MLIEQRHVAVTSRQRLACFPGAFEPRVGGEIAVPARDAEAQARRYPATTQDPAEHQSARQAGRRDRHPPSGRLDEGHQAGNGRRRARRASDARAAGSGEDPARGQQPEAEIGEDEPDPRLRDDDALLPRKPEEITQTSRR